MYLIYWNLKRKNQQKSVKSWEIGLNTRLLTKTVGTANVLQKNALFPLLLLSFVALGLLLNTFFNNLGTENSKNYLCSTSQSSVDTHADHMQYGLFIHTWRKDN